MVFLFAMHVFFCVSGHAGYDVGGAFGPQSHCLITVSHLYLPVLSGPIDFPCDPCDRMATTFTGGATSHGKGGTATFLEQLHPLTDIGK